MSVEEAVIEREELYWSGVELQTEMIYQYKPDGQLIFVDDTFCRYFGKKSKQLIGQNFMQFIPQQDRKKFKHHLASFSRNNPSSTVNRRVMKSNGDIVWQRCHDSAIFDDRSRIKGYQTAGIEILGEQKIPEKEIFLQNILDAIQDGISVLDKDLNILRTNSTLKKWYPNSGPIEGKKCHEVYHNRKKACKNCPTIRALESGRVETEIMQWVVSQEQMGWFEIFSYPLISSTGKVTGFIEYIRNITDRVNAEHELRESLQRFHIFADFTYDWEYWIAPDGNFIYISPSCERVTGYSADNFYQDPRLLEKIVHPDDRALLAEHLKKDMTNKDAKALDFRIISRDSTERWVRHICQPVYDNRQKFLGRRASNREITEQKKALEGLRKIKKVKEDLESQVQERTIYLKSIADKLKSREKELLDHKSRLEKVNLELLETNRAIGVLAKNIDKSRQETENTVANSINSKIMPIIEGLRNAKNLENMRVDLDILAANLQSMSGELTGGTNMTIALTPAELRVATMIKNGLTSQKIADKLHISLHTAKTHRRNIRKKLNIINSRVNLASYLKSLMW